MRIIDDPQHRRLRVALAFFSGVLAFDTIFWLYTFLEILIYQFKFVWLLFLIFNSLTLIYSLGNIAYLI